MIASSRTRWKTQSWLGRRWSLGSFRPGWKSLPCHVFPEWPCTCLFPISQWNGVHGDGDEGQMEQLTLHGLVQNVGFLFLSPRAMSLRMVLDNIYFLFPSMSATSSEGFRFLESSWPAESASPSCYPLFYYTSFHGGVSMALCISYLLPQ